MSVNITVARRLPDTARVNAGYAENSRYDAGVFFAIETLACSASGASPSAGWNRGIE